MGPHTEHDHEQLKAETQAASERAMKSPASQAACEIACAAWNNDAFPLAGFLHKVFPTDKSNNDYADVEVAWKSDASKPEGEVYALSMSFHVIAGLGDLSLDVDGRTVMDLHVHVSPNQEKIEAKVTGGLEFECGPWEDHIVEVARQLRAAGPRRTRC